MVTILELGYSSVHRARNHPVHIIDRKSGKKSPSSFIPFCDFGNNISLVGQFIDNFQFPVCNIFEEKVLNDQLCYAADIDKLMRNIKTEEARVSVLKNGFVFYLDNNRDRQMNITYPNNDKGLSLIRNMFNNIENTEFMIYINSIGKEVNKKMLQ